MRVRVRVRLVCVSYSHPRHRRRRRRRLATASPPKREGEQRSGVRVSRRACEPACVCAIVPRGGEHTTHTHAHTHTSLASKKTNTSGFSACVCVFFALCICTRVSVRVCLRHVFVCAGKFVAAGRHPCVPPTLVAMGMMLPAYRLALACALCLAPWANERLLYVAYLIIHK